MESVYQNIFCSSFFSKLPIIPSSKSEMEEFILAHDGWSLFDDRINALYENVNVSPIQLDAIYVLTKTIHCYYSDFISKVTNKVTLIIKECFDDMDIKKFVQNNISFDEIVRNIYDEIIPNITLDYFILHCQEMVDYWIMEPHHSDNESIMIRLKQNGDKFIPLFEEMYNIYRTETNKLLPIGNYIISLCIKENLLSDEKIVLEKFISENISKVIPPDEDPITDIYLDCVYPYKSQLPISYYQNRKNSQSYYDYGREITINHLLKPIGYQIEMKKTFVHTAVECFVEHGFGDKRNILDMIHFILATEKDTIGYTNKYDTMTLFEHYNLISIANGIEIPYEHCLISTNPIVSPLEFLVEILLRILSRFYNVNIMLYSSQLVPLFIDNALSYDVPIISIYQYSPDAFYNIFPIGTTFQPLARTMETIYSAPVNDTNDIVDV